MTERNILIVAGDYDLIEQINNALAKEASSLSHAFNYRDALYMFRLQRYDMLLIDVRIHSGDEPIYSLIAGLRLVQHIILLDPDGTCDNSDFLVLRQFDRETIIHAIVEVATIRPSAAKDKQQETNRLVAGRRIEEVEALLALSKSLTEVLDYNVVLQRVVDAARRLTDAEEAMLLLPDEEGSALYLRARAGVDQETAANFRIRTEDSLAGDVFYTGKPALVGAQGPQKLKTEYYVNSLLYVPVLLKGMPIGVLGVNNKQKEDVFDIHHQNLLLDLASYAAIALENARVHEESLLWVQELEMLVEASRVVNSNLSLENVLLNICEQFSKILKISWTEILVWEREENSLYTRALHRRANWRFGRGPRTKLKAHPGYYESLTSGKPFWASVEQQQPPFGINQGVESFLFLPLQTDGEPLGAVIAYYVTTPSIRPAQGKTITATHLGLQALVDMLATEDQTNTIGRSPQEYAYEIAQILGADWCDLATYHDDQQTLILQASAGTGIWVERHGPGLSLAQNDDLIDMLEAQTLIMQRESGSISTPGGLTLLRRAFARSILALPLINRGRTYGMVLFADTRSNRTFLEREIHLGRALAGQASMALENASLVHDLERSLADLHEAQDRLVQSARLSAMGELAAVVAHQINNPLTTIIVDAELLQQETDPDSLEYTSLAAIVRAGKRAASVARRLLSIVRSTDEETPNVPIDVIDTITGVLALVKTHIAHSNIRLITELPDDPVPPVLAVKGQLEDIWLNLLLNARDALSGQRQAEIGLKATYLDDSQQLRVDIWDNGPGIPQHLREQIFKPFFTTKPPGEGTGLGLHICTQVIQQVGGSIDLEDVPGHGAHFVIFLPVVPWSELHDMELE